MLSGASCNPIIVKEQKMKRQTRPFVVEVRKRRAGPAAKPSIWAGIDLGRIEKEVDAAEVAVDRSGERPASNMPERVRSVMEEMVVEAQAAGVVEPSLDRAVGALLDDDDGARGDLVQRSSRRDRRRVDAVEALPRGQRWMRRLPAVLLQRKRRES